MAGQSGSLPCRVCWLAGILRRQSHLVGDLPHSAQGLLRLQLLQGEQGEAQLVFLEREQEGSRGPLVPSGKAKPTPAHYRVAGQSPLTRVANKFNNKIKN